MPVFFRWKGFHRAFPILWQRWLAGKDVVSLYCSLTGEAQYRCTIEHIQKMREMYHDVTEIFYWVALPLTTVNGVSQFQPEWICWEPGVTWVRQPPEEAITDMTYFPFYRYAMTFEEFVPAFSSLVCR
ncbi:putative phosphoadenosine phosphosulfate reductase [Escherichia coli]|uniref:Putative phosphoadenosine phosphosulfate reductase n=1 Tax=Escherichia coli TaxID=562 RepID=A0A376L2I4_ECOLX|nr:putative phosphoadenosine phosphosulfate reductase [Escherichia coli]